MQIGLIVLNQGSGTTFGKQFQQNCMRHFAVQNDDTFDTLVERVDTGLNLRNHAT